MNHREQYQGRCLQGHSVKRIHQSSLCFRSRFNIICIIPKFLVCHIQFSPLSLTHMLPVLLAQIKVSSNFSGVEQLLCSHVTHTVFPTTKGSHTSGKQSNLTSSYCICPPPRFPPPIICSYSKMLKSIVQIVRNHMGNLLGVYTAPVLSRIQLIEAGESAHSPLNG